MKRILSALVAVALAFGMAACGAPAASTSTPASSAASSAASASASSEAATEAKPTQDRSGAAITLPAMSAVWFKFTPEPRKKPAAKAAPKKRKSAK